MSCGADHSDDGITIGGYILERLVQLGVKKIYGVPGDSNLGFLDLLEDHPNLDWVGCCNELNASYAADGYARVSKAGLGCLVTTFGVGELSVINGIAGAYAEQVPILHLVGVPSTNLQAKNPVIHHTMGDGKYDTYSKIATQITCTQSLLTSPENSTHEIDRLLKAALTQCRPVYLTLPTNIVYLKVPRSELGMCLRLQMSRELEYQLDSKEVDQVIGCLSELFGKATNPIVLIDGNCDRFKLHSQVMKFVESIQVPVYSTLLAKTVIGEDHKLFRGFYVGRLSNSRVKEEVESADLIFWIGPLVSDVNTGSFSFNLGSGKVELHPSVTIIKEKHYPSIGFRQLLPLITERLSFRDKKSIVLRLDEQLPINNTNESSAHGKITQAEFWPLWASHFFEANDVILGETGTSMFGLFDVKIPCGARYIFQVLWASIGWSTGACLGAAHAAEEQAKRTILFIGDGSLQISVQEISTMVRSRVKPIIVVLNNEGYVMERVVHGSKRKYNEIQPWRWTAILDLFDPERDCAMATYSTETRDELVNLLMNPNFRKADRIQLVEVKLGKEDAPQVLKDHIQALREISWD